MHKHFVWKWSTQICLHATYTHTFGVINTGLDTLSGNRERQWSDPGFNHSWLADLRRLIVQRKWLKVNSLYVNVLILLSITSTCRPILSHLIKPACQTHPKPSFTNGKDGHLVFPASPPPPYYCHYVFAWHPLSLEPRYILHIVYS